jgi:PTH1 family peptidyl-tRNA hydrolase
MKLIVFLGNPGLKYRKTRHNMGFMVGDFYARQQNVKFKNFIKFGAEVAESTEKDKKVLLIKPQKFYNLTGEVVQNFIKFYKLSSANLTVVCDDLNLDFGKFRVRDSGSDGGNNGLRSIIAQIGPEFKRIRIGTNNEMRAQIGDTDFVLSKFSKEEQAKLPGIFESVIKNF